MNLHKQKLKYIFINLLFYSNEDMLLTKKSKIMYISLYICCHWMPLMWQKTWSCNELVRCCARNRHTRHCQRTFGQ